MKRGAKGRGPRQITKKIVFLGAGNMAEALISGLVAGRVAPSSSITATDMRPERLAYLRRKRGIKTERDNRAAVRNADILVIAVKPQHIEALLNETGTSVRRTQLVISIAAGITTEYIERFVPAGTPVIRVMPNTPALLGAGAIAIAAGRNAKRGHMALAKKFFAASGSVVELPEDRINAVTALSGSGPAYVFLLAEAMEQAGIAMGLPADVAALLARQTVYGSGLMLGKLPAPAAELRKNVTSPGGTTAAAIEIFAAKGFHELVRCALEGARDRARELAK
jgi:pyrroline-5-carboxylate reductase